MQLLLRMRPGRRQAANRALGLAATTTPLRVWIGFPRPFRSGSERSARAGKVHRGMQLGAKMQPGRGFPGVSGGSLPGRFQGLPERARRPQEACYSPGMPLSTVNPSATDSTSVCATAPAAKRKCPACLKPISGRKNKIYCGDGCRDRFWRAGHHWVKNPKRKIKPGSLREKRKRARLIKIFIGDASIQRLESLIQRFGDASRL
jgi:hypothetical protein